MKQDIKAAKHLSLSGFAHIGIENSNFGFCRSTSSSHDRHPTGVI